MKIRSKLQTIIGLMATLIQDFIWTITGIILIFTLCQFTSSAYPLAKIEIPEKYEYLNVVEEGTLRLETGEKDGNYWLESYRALSSGSEDVGSQFFKTANTYKTEEYRLGPFEMVVHKGWKYTVDAVWIYTIGDDKKYDGIAYGKTADSNTLYYDDRLVDVQISGNEDFRTVGILIKGPLTKQILDDPATDPDLQDLLTERPHRRVN